MITILQTTFSNAFSSKKIFVFWLKFHLFAMASQNTGDMIVYSTFCSCAAQRKHQSAASLDFIRAIHRSSVNSPHKGPVTQKMFPFDDVIMLLRFQQQSERGTAWYGRRMADIQRRKPNVPGDDVRTQGEESQRGRELWEVQLLDWQVLLDSYPEYWEGCAIYRGPDRQWVLRTR